MAVKFTDLSQLSSAPAADDLFAIQDTDLNVTSFITFGTLQDSIVSDDLFNLKASQIITAINDQGTAGNGLNANYLWYSGTGQYEPASYFLDYENFTGSLTITPELLANVSLSNLNNSSEDGFIKLINITGVGPRLVFDDNVNTASPQVIINTDNIPEGPDADSNKYYTEDRIDDYMTANFGRFYTQYTATFDEGNIQDSVFDAKGSFQQVIDSQSRYIRINRYTDPTDPTRQIDYRTSFKAGQTVRVYGASADENNVISADKVNTPKLNGVSVSAKGIPTTGSGSPNLVFQYRAAEFMLETGDIAPSTAQTSINLWYDAAVGFESLADFSVDKYLEIGLDISDAANRGVAIWRKVLGGGEENAFNDTWRLIAVLGPKERNARSYIDYYTFDYVQYGGRDVNDNSFNPDTVIHFKGTPPDTGLRGWVDKTINQVLQREDGSIWLDLGSNVFVNADGACQVSHNDTQLINTAVQNNIASGRKSLELNAKTYVTGRINLIPEGSDVLGFGIAGIPYITKFVKLPWSGFDGGANDGKFVTVNGNNKESVSLVGLDLDGNALYQFLFDDSSIRDVNVAVDFGFNCESPLLDKVRLTNPVAGGIYTPNPRNLKITNSEVRDSNTLDKYVGNSPLVADGGTNTIIVGNQFANFTDAIDLTVTSRGVFTGNIVDGTGSGVEVFGSTFFISADNVLRGPAGEFLSSPDILNSEYDSINVNITSHTSGTVFYSDRFVYQENGELWSFNPLTNDKVVANGLDDLAFTAFKINRYSNGNEERQSPDITDLLEKSSIANEPTTGQEVVLAEDVGQFAFKVTPTNVERVGRPAIVPVTGNLTALDYYKIMELGNTNWEALGASSTPTVTEVFQATDANLSLDPSSYLGTGKVLPVDSNGNYVNTQGNLSYQYLKAIDPNHDGLGWEATYEYETILSVEGVQILDAIDGAIIETTDTTPYELTSFNAQADDQGRNYFEIFVKLTLLEGYAIAVGDRVVLDPASGTGTFDGTLAYQGRYVGEVKELLEPGDGTINISIKYLQDTNADPVPATPNISINVGSDAVINIVDKFVLAQGRIL
jgi:hypothetical protein